MSLSWCFWCCRVLLLLLFCFCFFFHTTKRKKKYYFVRFALPPLRYFEEFDNLPHFDNGSCVCTLFSEHFIISVKSYIYCYSIVNGGVWQWRAVECVRLFEMCVVGRWTIAVNLDGISLLTQCSLLPVSLYFLQTVHVERHLGSLCLVALMHAVFEANGENELTRSFCFFFFWKVAMMNVAMTQL